MIDTFKGMANTWECDENGHLNVRYYVAKTREGLATLWHALGLTRAQQDADDAEMVIVDTHLRFLREVHPGRGVFGRAGIVALGESDVRVYAELVNVHTDDVAATFNIQAVYRDRKTGAPKTLPGVFAEQAAHHRVAVPAHGAPRSIALDAPSVVNGTPPDLAGSDGMGLFEISRGVVQASETDDKGRMAPEHYIGRISDGVVHLTRHFRPTQTGKDRSLAKYGGAVLEYRLCFHHPLHVGDIVVVRSGLKQVGEKANHMVHWTFNGETGVLVSTSEAVGITLDLEARKVVPLPEDRRAHLETLVVPGLSI